MYIVSISFSVKNHTLTVAVEVCFVPMVLHSGKGNSKNYKFHSNLITMKFTKF